MRGNHLLFQPEDLHSLGKGAAVDRVAVPQQIPRGAAIRESLHQLLCCQVGRRRIGHIEVQDLAPMMGQNQKHEQHPTGDRWDREEVDGDQILQMSLEESSPGWRGASALGPVLPDRRIQYVNVQLEEFRLDAPTTPSWICFPHASHESNELTVGRRTAVFTPGLPAPEEPKSQAMPL